MALPAPGSVRAKAADHFSLGQGRKPFFFLLLRAPLQQRHGNHGLDRQHTRQGRRSSAQGFIQQTERDDVPSLSAIIRRQTAAQVTGLRQQRYHGIRNSLLPIPLLGKRFNVQGDKLLELLVSGPLLRQSIDAAYGHRMASSDAGAED